MVFPLYIWLLFTVTLAISAIGFKRYVWFISLGYGFSIAGEGILMMILYGIGQELTLGTVICCACSDISASSSSCSAARGVWKSGRTKTAAAIPRTGNM